MVLRAAQPITSAPVLSTGSPAIWLKLRALPAHEAIWRRSASAHGSDRDSLVYSANIGSVAAGLETRRQAGEIV